MNEELLVWTVPRLMQECFVHLFTIGDARLCDRHTVCSRENAILLWFFVVVSFFFRFLWLLLLVWMCGCSTRTTTYCMRMWTCIPFGSKAREKEKWSTENRTHALFRSTQLKCKIFYTVHGTHMCINSAKCSMRERNRFTTCLS